MKIFLSNCQMGRLPKGSIASMVCLLFAFTTVSARLYRSARIYKVTSQEEFKKAAALVMPGDEIVISDGNYSGWELIVNTSGTADQPILIHAATPGKGVFSGDVNRPIFQLTGKYTEIAGLSFSGCNVFKTKEDNGYLIELKDAQYCRVTDCIFTHNTAKVQFMPIVVISGKSQHDRIDHCHFIGNIDNQELQIKITEETVPLYSLIDHNEFKDKDKVNWKVFNGGECVQIGQDPILLGTQAPFSTVRDNRFIHCDGEPEVISNKSTGNKYINNYFEDCHGELVMRGGHDCLIDSNTFKGGTGGIRVNGTHHTITNNILDGLPTGIRLMYGMAKGREEIGFYIAASDCRIENNHITNAGTGILIGDSKNADWTGKFDTTRYPSRTMQDVAPFNNTIGNNSITATRIPIQQQ